MLSKSIILLSLVLMGCTRQFMPNAAATSATVPSVPELPAGVIIVEQQPDGRFIRLSSATRIPGPFLRPLADNFCHDFDRVDLCLDAAHERGDEYLSIIGRQVFDYENDNIYSLNTL